MHYGKYGPRESGSVAGFVGRDSELTSVSQALEAPPAIVLVEGEPGIGKTRLVQESLSLRADRHRTMEVTCLPLEDPFPLGAVVDALHREPLADVELSPLAGALRPLFPEWTAALPPAPEPLEDAGATRHRLLRALVELLERLELDVLVVEDAHWADTSTLELLLMLSATQSSDISLVVTYRPTEVPPGSLLTRLSSRSSFHRSQLRVSLGPLGAEETGALVAAMFDTTSVSPEFVAFLHERTDGIPLALEETLSLLRDRGDIGWHGGEWGRRALEELQVPPTVRDSVRERVDRLDPSAQQVLAATAVLAAPSGETVLAEVAGLDDEAARHGLAAALASGLLREAGPGVFAFRHVLACRAVEDRIAVPERRRMHHRAASALHDVVPLPVARLSRHFREAHDLAAWSAHAEAAADIALESGDDHAAVVLLLELLTAAGLPPEPRARVARKLGEAAAWGAAALGDLGRDVIEALRAFLGDETAGSGDLGRIRLVLGRLLLQLGEFDSAAAEIETAVGDLGDEPDLTARAMISLAWPRGHAWPAAKHVEWLERATRLFHEVPAGPQRTWLEVDRASALLMLGDERGWEHATELAGRGGTLAEQRQIARCLMNVGHVGIAWGRDQEARRVLDESVELMRSTGYRRLLNSCSLTIAHLDWHSGEWTELSDRVALLGEAEETLPEARLEARQIQALLDLATGNRAAAARDLGVVLEEATRRGVADAQMSPAAALARLSMADGRTTEALDLIEPVVEILVRKGMWLWASEIAPVYVDALVETGRLRAADTFVEQFATGVGGSNAPAPTAALDVCRAVLADTHGRAEQAQAEFASATKLWSELPRPYAAQLTSERLGRLLLRTGDRDEALRRLSSVQERLQTLGARWDADRVARLLREHGVEVARVWRGGRRGYGDQLSPRELEVTRLVAQGLTNRQAAEALFLSPRTVDRHLGAAMRKLGVRSRTALAVASTELPDDAPKNG